MAGVEAARKGAPRRWGEDRALLDDEEARRRLVEAAGRCIVRRGDAHVRMAEVADEAGVARSTLYRYFPNRAELIVGLLLSRVDRAFDAIVRALPAPDDAARSLPDVVLEPIALVEGNPLNEALFSPESAGYVSTVELGSEPLLDAAVRHFGPLLERWQERGQVRDELDVRETVRWIGAVSLILLAPPWRQRSKAMKRRFLEEYVVPALLTAGPRGSDTNEVLSDRRQTK